MFYPVFASRPARLVLLFVTLFVGLCVASLSCGFFDILFGQGTRTALLCQSAAQAVFAFIIPAYVSVKIAYGNAYDELGISRGFSVSAILITLAIMFTAVPFLNQIISLNESIAFSPDIEKVFRQWENQALSATNSMLDTDTVSGLVSGVLVVGLLTGIGEEFFFRGALQKMLRGKGVSAHGAIWIAATVFSIMHFQPYGFVPRLLLGAFFGYLYWWSGTIWLPVIAHAVNNSMVVIVAWIRNCGADMRWFETCGTSDDGTLWISAMSFVVAGSLTYIASRIIPNSK